MSVAAIEGVIIEGSGAVLLARVTGASGDAVTQASVSAIAWECWKTDVPPGRIYPSSTTTVTPTKTGTGTGVVADVIYDTLQTDDRWTVDATGYNFALSIPAASWPVTDIDDYPDSGWAQVDVKITPTTGEVFYVAYQVELKPILYGKTV